MRTDHCRVSHDVSLVTMERTDPQYAKPDAEDQDVEELIGEETDDLFPDTWPDDLDADDRRPDVEGEMDDEYLHESEGGY